MLSSKIKVGQEYAVSVEFLDSPHTAKGMGGSLVKVGAQSSPHRKPFVRDTWSRKRLVRATVVAVKADRWEGRGYSSFVQNKKDGVLVEFASPVKTSRIGASTEVSSATVTSAFLIETWEDHERRNESAAAAAQARAIRDREASVVFAQRFEVLVKQLEQVGLGPVKVHEDVSGFYGKGFSMRLNSAIVDGKRVPIGFGDTQMLSVSSSLFFKLIQVAASIGEVVCA